MFKNAVESGYLEFCQAEAVEYIKEDRLRYKPIFDIVEGYVKENGIFVDSLALLLGRDTDDSMFHGVWTRMNLWSRTPHDHAMALTKKICEKVGDKAKLGVMALDVYYVIEYNTRQLIYIRFFAADVAHTIDVNGIKIYPPFLKQLDLVADLLDIGKFSDWEGSLTLLRDVFPFVVKTKPALCDVDGPPPLVVQMREEMLKYIETAPYSIVSANPKRPLEVIYYKDIDTALHDLKLYIAKFTETDIFYKPSISHKNVTKHTIYTSRDNWPLLNMYNLGTFLVVPHVDKTFTKMAPVGVVYIALLNIWFASIKGDPLPAYYWDLFHGEFSKLALKRYFYKGTYISEDVRTKIKLVTESRGKPTGTNTYYCEKLN